MAVFSGFEDETAEVAGAVIDNLAETIQHIRPGASWMLLGSSYEGLEWLDESMAKPTLQEVQTAAPLVGAQLALEAVQRLRRDAYQQEADPLFFKWQRGEGAEQEWLDKVAEIRARFSTAE